MRTERSLDIIADDINISVRNFMNLTKFYPQINLGLTR